MITILQYYPYCAGAGGTGGAMTTPWVPYPELYADCEVHVVCHNHNSGGVEVSPETSVNGVDPEGLGAALSISAIGQVTGTKDVTGSLVRVVLAATEPTVMTISVYLVPKMS